MRIIRPGTVVGPQQQYMYLKQLEWAKWAAVDEMKKLQAQQIAALTAAAAATKVVAPATPPAEDEEMKEVSTTTTATATILTKQLPPVTPSKHVAAAQEKAKLISPPGQPRKTPVAKRKSTNDWEEEDTDEAFPPIVLATTTATTNTTTPARPQKVKKIAPRSAAPSTRATASDQRPTRVTRSTTSAKNKLTSGQANNLTTGSPVKSMKPISSLQPPNKIPRLAHGTTTRSTTSKPVPINTNIKSNENSNSNSNTTTKRAPQKSPTPGSPTLPSRLPTLVGKRPTHHASNSLCDLAVGTRSTNRSGSVGLSGVKEDSAWVSENAGAVSIPTSRTEKPSLRSSRRRRSSFSEV